MWSENWGSAIGSFKGMFGMKTYAEKDGALQLDFKDENYKPMMKYINQIKREDYWMWNGRPTRNNFGSKSLHQVWYLLRLRHIGIPVRQAQF